MKDYVLTLNDIVECIITEGYGDEQGKDLFSGASGPSHEAGHIEQRVQDKEEAVPQPHRAVHRVEVQIKVLADVVDDWESRVVFVRCSRRLWE